MSQKGTKWYQPIIAFFLILLALILLPFVLLFQLAYCFWLRNRFWSLHGKKGRFILFVYSDSPNWKDYIESNILPRIAGHAVILNWSKRQEWQRINPFEVKVFKQWAGDREFNPLAIIISRSSRVKVIRFWQAFRDYKHGNEKLLKEVEHSLFKEIDGSPATDV
jgi:hypothetical protein